MTISTGLSDFPKMIITVLKFSFIKLKAQGNLWQGLFETCPNLFREDLALILDHANQNYDSFEDAFMKTHKRDAEMKKKFVRANEAPYITKKTNYENVWTER